MERICYAWRAPIGIVLSLLIFVVLPTLTLAQTDERLARIITPVREQTLRGNVTIQGTASSPFFSRYVLAYAQEPDLASWVEIGGAIQPVQGGMLGVWNTRPLPDGQYALRLQVFDSNGSVTESIVRNLQLANASAAPEPAITTIITDTAANAGVVAEVQTARNVLQIIAATLSEMPDAFMRGARLAILAFLAFGAYVALKRIVLFAVQRLARRPVDYGR